MSVHNITEKNYDEMVTKSERPVLLEFGAEYCAPCRVLAPIIKRVSDERKDVMVGAVDVEDSPSIAARLGVMSLPTVVVLSVGKVTGRASGKISYEQVLGLLV